MKTKTQAEKAAEYWETREHYARLIRELGRPRIEEVYRDALFLVNVPRHRLTAICDALTLDC